MIDAKENLTAATDHLLRVGMKIEGVGASMLALAADLDGTKTITHLQAARALELLASACTWIQHELGTAYEIIDEVAAEGGRDHDD